MKRNSKRRHPFVLVYLENDETYFVDMLQSPKCPERYAWHWALKFVRDWLRKSNISFEEWSKYQIYPVDRHNCSQFGWNEDDKWIEHIHVSDEVEEDDEATIKWYNEIKSKWKPTIK